MSDILSKEERIKILKTMEEDIEFRYAIAGMLGILDMFRRLDSIESRIEEHSKRLEELTRRVEEHNKILQEHSKILQEHSKRLEELTRRVEEHNKILQEHSKILQEHSKRLEELTRRVEEHNKILQEHNRRLEDIAKILEALVNKVSDHSEKINGLRREVSSLSLVVGALTESFYAKSIYEDLVDEIRRKEERVLKRIRNAKVDDIDIDLLIETNKSVYIIEVKVKPEYEDVGRLIAKIDIVKRYYPEKDIVGMLAGSMIGKEVEAYAKGKGIKVYTY